MILRPGGMIVLVENEATYVRSQQAEFETLRLTSSRKLSFSGQASQAVKTWNACVKEACAERNSRFPL
jgi:hypothetical protein